MKKRKPKKIVKRYLESDIVHEIGAHFEGFQSPEGFRFEPHHLVDNTLLLKIGTQTFIITCAEKERLN